MFRRLLSDESGASLVEYALVLVLVAIVAIAAMKVFGADASNTLGAAANSI